MLHLTKVAFGCVSLDDLTRRLAARAPGPVRLTTRYRPKRHEEIVGGSLFWILKHQLIGRSEIVGFADADEGRTDILLAPHVVPVRTQAKRAHQGWRYLEAADAPGDLSEGESTDEIPVGLVGELAALGLI